MKEYTFDIEIDTDVVFQTIEEDIPLMLPVIDKILNDLENKSTHL